MGIKAKYLQTKDILKLQKESEINIYKIEKTGTYTFNDLLEAYEIEKENNANLVITGEIAIKLLMPYIYRTLSKDILNKNREEIITECYLALVGRAFNNLDMNKISRAKYPENMFCGYCKLYLKEVLTDYVREGVSHYHYEKGIRQAVPMSMYENENKKLNDKSSTSQLYDNPFFGLIDEGFEIKNNDNERLNFCCIFAYVYNVKFSSKIDINDSKMIDEIMNSSDISQKTKDDFIQLLHEKIIESQRPVLIKKEPKILKESKGDNHLVVSKLKESNPTYKFIYGYLKNLNNKQLDEFIEHFNVYDKMKEFCNKYEIPFPDLNPYSFKYEKKPTMWEQAISNKNALLPSEKKYILQEIKFDEEVAELQFDEELKEMQ